MSDDSFLSDQVEEYGNAVRHTERCVQSLSEAQADEFEAEQVLGKRLCPQDVQVGEEIGVWIRPNRSVKLEKLLLCKADINPTTGAMFFRLRWRE